MMWKGMCKNKCVVHWITWVLVIIGGINWGLVAIGIFAGNPRWNVLHLIFGGVGMNTPWLEGIIYLLVGIAAISLIVGCRCKKCKEGHGCHGGVCGGSSTMSSGGMSSMSGSSM